MADRPNLLILMADQLTPRALKAYGGRVARTPNIDVLAGPVAGPAGDVEEDRLDAGCLGHDLDEFSEVPGQSPE